MDWPVDERNANRYRRSYGDAIVNLSYQCPNVFPVVWLAVNCLAFGIVPSIELDTVRFFGKLQTEIGQSMVLFESSLPLKIW